jgi:hypothetical protein
MQAIHVELEDSRSHSTLYCDKRVCQKTFDSIILNKSVVLRNTSTGGFCFCLFEQGVHERGCVRYVGSFQFETSWLRQVSLQTSLEDHSSIISHISSLVPISFFFFPFSFLTFIPSDFSVLISLPGPFLRHLVHRFLQPLWLLLVASKITLLPLSFSPSLIMVSSPANIFAYSSGINLAIPSANCASVILTCVIFIPCSLLRSSATFFL